MNWRRIYAVFWTRNLEFVRDRSAMAWTFALPVLVVFGFALGFSEDAQQEFKIGFLGEAEQSLSMMLADTRHLEWIEVDHLSNGLRKVQRHQLDVLIDFQQKKYWINEQSSRGHIVERVLWATAGPAVDFGLSKGLVSGEGLRYVDWLMPGMLGMNVMFAALFGVGFVIVRYRKNGVLKRLQATPLTAFEFLSAQVISRLVIVVLASILIYVGCDYFLDFQMHGSYWNLMLVLLLGSLSMIAMGLLVAARVASEELAGGLLNLLSWPMMFLSGVWFSTEGLHPWLNTLAKLLPLTHMIDAGRAIMIDGASLAELTTPLWVLLVMTAVFMLIGSLMFRWE